MNERNERRFLLKLEPDGSMYLAEFSDIGGEDAELSALQGVVGGYIEHVLEPKEVRGRCIFYVNEEGLRRGLEVNLCASVLCGAQIVGNLCVCRGDIPETFFTKEEAEAMAMKLFEIFSESENVMEGTGDGSEDE